MPNQPQCPRCGSRMALRTARGSGTRFWGCTRYPSCRGTRNYGGAQAGGRPLPSEGGVRRDTPSGSRRSTGRTAAVGQPTAGLPIDLAKRLGKLLRFYDDCLERESVRELSFPKEESTGRLIYGNFPPAGLLAGGSLDTSGRSDDAGRLRIFVAEQRVGGVSQGLHYAYPLVLLSDDVRGAQLAPLMYIPLIVELHGDNYRLLAEDHPRVNYLLLERGGFSLEESIGIASEIEERLESASANDLWACMRTEIERLVNDIPLKIVESLDPNNLATSPSIRDLDEDGIYNRGLVFKAERLGFTASVRAEMERISNGMGLAVDTPLVPLLVGDYENAPSTGEEQVIVVTPLSEAQRQALTSAMANRITVVTGPPGTGKSQLVLNLVANVLLRGQTVLVASRNNKAVDVLCDRFTAITDEAALLRTGHRNARDGAIAIMRKVVAGVPPPTQSELDAARNRLEAVQAQRKALSTSIADRLRAAKVAEETAGSYEVSLANCTSDQQSQLQKIDKRAGDAALVATLRRIETRLERYLKGWRRLDERLVSVFVRNHPLQRERRSLLSATDRRADLLGDFVPPLGEGANWEQCVAHARSARHVAEAMVARSAWQSAKAALLALPSRQKLVDEFTTFEEQEAKVGRAFVALSRRSSLGTLPREDRLRLEEYLRVVGQLNGPELLGSQMYARLKELEGRLFTQIQKIFPVWALTNLTARRNLPLESRLFDMVIIDEASQCDIPSAIPLLIRAKRAVIIGDAKQLIHVTPLSSGMEQALAHDAELSAEELNDFSYRKVSLFGLAEHSLRTDQGVVFLDEHYRSHPQIIEFSNALFYGRRLKVYTPPEKLLVPVDGAHPAVRWVQVEGTCVRPPSGSAFNKEEVEMVINSVVDLLREHGKRGISIGVVTPFRLQKQRIAERLHQAIPPAVLEAHSVIVDTAHGFQGDERDIMIFSPVISHGADSRTVNFANNEPNLFNVAITRARSLLMIVGDEAVCKAQPGLLAQLADYTSQLRIGLIADALDGKGSFQTEDERSLYEVLAGSGYQVQVQRRIGGMHVDLSIEQSDRRLAIEVDGASHDSGDGSPMLRDLLRDHRLQGAGWQVLRIPAWQVRLDPAACVASVNDALSSPLIAL
jgi:very-short-patch-repair endonuclease/RecA/RadA recombinase